MSSVGIMVGALASGPAGDRLGRKPVLIAGRPSFLAVSSIACVFAASVSVKLVMVGGSVTGIGIGAIGGDACAP